MTDRERNIILAGLHQIKEEVERSEDGHSARVWWPNATEGGPMESAKEIQSLTATVENWSIDTDRKPQLPPTRDKVVSFLGKLEDDRIAKAYFLADAVAKETDDTLTDEFQLAASIVDAVQNFIRDRLSGD